MSDLPETYKACIYDKPGHVSTKVVDLPMPDVEAGQVLIKLSHSGVCHSGMLSIHAVDSLLIARNRFRSALLSPHA